MKRPNTISQMISRKILKGRAIGDTPSLQDDRIEALETIYNNRGASEFRGH